VVVHLVLFNPKPTLDKDQLKSFAQTVQAQLRAIPGITRALVGKAIDLQPSYPRSLGDQTYEYAAIMEFQREEDLLAYLEHPTHRQLGRLFWDACGSTVVMEARMADVLQDDIAIVG
jgi:hypothetical protein